MVYDLVSIDEVIEKVLTYTRLNDSSYIADIYSFIVDGMDMLKTRYRYVRMATPINVVSHSAKLPPCIGTLLAVSYKGKRLRMGSDVRGINPYTVNKKGTFKTTVLKSQFDTDEQVIQDISYKHQPFIPLDGTDLTVPTDYCSNNDFYMLDVPYIKTSFDSGTIVVFYKSYRVDDNGWPMIPDNTRYKLALTWYVRAALIGMGHKDIANFSYQYCMDQFDEYGRIARQEISYPNKDMEERIRRSTTNMIFNENAYDRFFVGAGGYRGVDIP